MKSNVLFALAIACTATWLFVPHHRRDADSFKPNTLAGIYRDAFADMPARWNAERATLLLALLAGVFSTVAPVALASMLRWHRPAIGAAGGVAFGIVALTAGVGAVANFCMILLNQTSFAFGGRPLPGDAVAFAWCVAAIQLGVAIAGFAAAVSSRVAAFVS